MDRSRAARYAPYVLYAWDMCDANLKAIPPATIDPRITAGRGTLLGFITASDCIVKTGTDLRSTVMGGGDRVCYGYVLDTGAEIVVAIRGTDGAQEWADDLDFLMIPHPRADGTLVDSGFFDIYQSMQFTPAAPGKPPAAGVPVTDGLKVLKKPITVLGHSLGAALATYLVLDLNLAGNGASACLFASPRTGDRKFADYFESKVSNYDVFNYERDVVPKVPNVDVMHLSAYQTLYQAKVIPDDGTMATIQDLPTCNHHLICYIALLDRQAYLDERAKPGFTSDDGECAQCVVRPA